MLFQLVGAAEHISAQANAAADPLGKGTGFLSLCLASSDLGHFDGSDTSLPFDGKPAPHGCVLCGTAATSNAMPGVHVEQWIAPFQHTYQRIQPASASIHLSSAGNLRYGTLRGPPLFVLSI